MNMESNKCKVLKISKVKTSEITEYEMIAYLKLTFYNLKHSGNTYLSVQLIIDYMYDLMRLYNSNIIVDYVKRIVK